MAGFDPSLYENSAEFSYAGGFGLFSRSEGDRSHFFHDFLQGLDPFQSFGHTTRTAACAQRADILCDAAGLALLPGVHAFELRQHLSAGAFPAKSDDSFAGRSASVVLLPYERR